jgi:hypothetical protein
MERINNIYDYIYKYKLEKIKSCIPIIFSRTPYISESEYSSYIFKLAQKINEDIPKDIILSDDIIEKYLDYIVGSILSVHINMLIFSIKLKYEDLYISRVLSDYYNKGDNYCISMLYWVKLFKDMINYKTCPILIMESERKLVNNKYIVKIINDYIGTNKFKYIRYVDTLFTFNSTNEELTMSNILKSPLFEIIKLVNSNTSY